VVLFVRYTLRKRGQCRLSEGSAACGAEFVARSHALFENCFTDALAGEHAVD